MSNSKKLKEMLEKKSILKIGGAFDALSAKLVEQLDTMQFGQKVLLFQQLHALPDASILTMTDFLKSAEIWLMPATYQ